MFEISPYEAAPLYLFPEDAQSLLSLHSLHPLAGRLYAEAALSPLLKPWVMNQWNNPQLIRFDSIKDAGRALRSLGSRWAAYYPQKSKRAEFIQAELPHLSAKPLIFGEPLPPFPPLGSWTLLDNNHIIAASDCSSIRANGEWNFVEDKEGPPSRAYLKLWEALTRTGAFPKKDELCLDLGASPGGWAYVLAEQLQSQVLAFDRSPLAPNLMKHPRITFTPKNAFSVDPKDYPQAKWLFCDVICYPEKLYEYIQQKILPSSLEKAVCTLKFQGSQHYKAIQDFLTLPNSQLIHLTHNKHELTWIWK